MLSHEEKRDLGASRKTNWAFAHLGSTRKVVGVQLKKG